MAQLSDKHVNQWDFSSWLKRGEALKGTVEVDGFLLAHPDPARVYFMSQASGPGVRFDLQRSDIVDVTENGQRVVFAEQTFGGVRIVLNLDAVVTRVSVHVASGLVEYADRNITNIAGDTMRIKNTVVATVTLR